MTRIMLVNKIGNKNKPKRIRSSSFVCKSIKVYENLVLKLILIQSSHGFISFALLWFYGIPTIVGYLMPNPVFTYILNI